MTASTNLSTPIPVVHLKIERKSSHPWIFQKMVVKPKEKIHPGTIVDIADRDGNWVGRGIYNGHSRIALRVLTTQPNETIDTDFFRQAISAAVSLRRDILGLDQITNAYRVVNSEGDNLSGLIVDRFDKILVMEFFSAGMFRFRETIGQILLEFFPDSSLYWFAEEHVQKQESFNCRAPEPPEPSVIQEFGVRFRVTPGSKHKTGFFVDQRENRKLIADWSKGCRVLDLCCNTGGFAVYAKTIGEAQEVVGVDLDEEVIGLAKQNANLNQARIRFVHADLFTWLRDIQGSGQQFDLVILDPAKQTRDRDAIPQALRRYLDMNRLAMQTVSPNGLFLTCSCTGLVSEDDFLGMLRRAAWQAGRTAQVLKVSGAGPDHPFLAHVQESRYLKAVFCRVI